MQRKSSCKICSCNAHIALQFSSGSRDGRDIVWGIVAQCKVCCCGAPLWCDVGVCSTVAAVLFPSNCMPEEWEVHDSLENT